MNQAGQDRSGRLRAAWLCFWATLLTLPWVGIGVAHLVTGRDLGGGLQPSWVLMGLTVLLAAPEVREFLVSHRRALLMGTAPFALAVLLSGLGLWLAPSGEGSQATFFRFIKQVIQLAVMMPFVLMPAFFIARGRSLGELAVPIVAGALLQAVYGGWQAVHFAHPLAAMAALERIATSNPAILSGSSHLYLENTLHNIPRLRGTACEPLYLGNFLLLALPLVASLTWPRPWRRLTAACLALLLILTWSRGAWLAAAGGGLVMLAGAGLAGVPLSWRRLARMTILGGVGLLGLALAAEAAGYSGWLLPWQRLQQSFSTVDWSNLTRLYSMQAAWRAFLLSPILGIGWGQFGFHFASLADPLGLQGMFTWPVVNNFPLAILCETGLVGLTGFAWAVASLVRRLVRQLRRLPLDKRWPVLALAAGVLAIWGQLLTFSQYNLPHIWVGLGLLAGVALAPGRAESGEAS